MQLDEILEEMDDCIRETREKFKGYEDNKALRLYVSVMNLAKTIVVKHMIAKDKNVPTNDGWIPVEEGLPKEYECTISNPQLRSESRAIHFMASDVVQGTLYDPTNGKYYIREVRTFDGKWRSWGDKTIAKCKVIAWQPLPEPYHSERRDNHDRE